MPTTSNSTGSTPWWPYACHQGSKMGWHGEKRAWAIAKMDEIDALNVTVERVIDYIMQEK
jgi:hypothetical protein